MGRGTCSRETQGWGRENWAMDVMWGYGDRRSHRWRQVREDTLPSHPSYEFSVNLLWEGNKTVTHRVAYPHWGYLKPQVTWLLVGWVAYLADFWLLRFPDSSNLCSSGVICFDTTLSKGSQGYNVFSTFWAEWLSQVFLIVTLVVGFMLQNYSLVSSKPVTVIISVPL